MKFERLQLQICRQIQGLPNRTANAAVSDDILLGLEPIQSVVNKLLTSNILWMYYSR